jgi:hypothetical protein
VLSIKNGIADLEINGERSHLGVSYLHVEYMPGGSSKGRVFSGYRIEGLVFGWDDDHLTTPKLIDMLNFLGFDFDSASFREEMTNPDETVDRDLKLISNEPFSLEKIKTRLKVAS